VSFQVIHADQGQIAPQGEPLGEVDADQQRARQARAARDRDGVDRVERQAGVVQGLPGDVGDRLDVRARRDFGEDAAILRVQVDLGRDDVR